MHLFVSRLGVDAIVKTLVIRTEYACRLVRRKHFRKICTGSERSVLLATGKTESRSSSAPPRRLHFNFSSLQRSFRAAGGNGTFVKNKQCRHVSSTPTGPDHDSSTILSSFARQQPSDDDHDPYERHRRQIAFPPPTSVDKLLFREYKKETAFTQRYIDEELQKTHGIDRKQILQEMEDAMQPQGTTPHPEVGPTGKYLYYYRDHLAVRTYLRRRTVAVEENIREQALFVINFQSERLGPMSLSVDEEYVARVVVDLDSTTTTTTISICHIESEKNCSMTFPAMMTIQNVEFGPKMVDGRHSFYFTTGSNRPNAFYQCFFDGHALTEPDLIVKDANEAHFVDVQRTKGCRFIAIHSTSKTSNEISLIGIDEGGRRLTRPILVRRRQEGVQYYVDCGCTGDVIIIAHCTRDSPSPETESELNNEMTVFETHITTLPLSTSFGRLIRLDSIPPVPDKSGSLRDDYFVEEIDIFVDHIALYERSSRDGRQRIRVVHRTFQKMSQVCIPLGISEFAVLSPGGNMNFHATTLRFLVETPFSPGKAYEFDFETHEVKRVSPISDEPKKTLSNDDYRMTRVMVPSRDGTNVPMTLVSAKANNTQQSPSRSTVLIGYGSYGQSQHLGFDPSLVPLLKRGFVIAYAHTRGGGELGKSWYQAGRLYNKERAVEDYIACAEALTGHLSITKSHMLGAKGVSAGGIIVGAAMNRFPTLFDAVALINPFLDVMNAMSNASLPLTQHEWEEFGNPNEDIKARACIASYCPFLNLSPQHYPVSLIVGTLDDTIVPCWQPVTFAKKLRNAKNEFASSKLGAVVDNGRMPITNNGIFLHVEEVGGHNLHGRRLDVAALEIAFLLVNLS